jgi:hypothetical protein
MGDTVTVGFKASVDEIEWLDAMAERAKLSRAEYMKRVILTALAQDDHKVEPEPVLNLPAIIEDAKDVEKLGIRAQFDGPGEYRLTFQMAAWSPRLPPITIDAYLLGFCATMNELHSAIRKAVRDCSANDDWEGYSTRRVE